MTTTPTPTQGEAMPQTFHAMWTNYEAYLRKSLPQLSQKTISNFREIFQTLWNVAFASRDAEVQKLKEENAVIKEMYEAKYSNDPDYKDGKKLYSYALEVALAYPELRKFAFAMSSTLEWYVKLDTMVLEQQEKLAALESSNASLVAQAEQLKVEVDKHKSTVEAACMTVGVDKSHDMLMLGKLHELTDEDRKYKEAIHSLELSNGIFGCSAQASAQLTLSRIDNQCSQLTAAEAREVKLINLLKDCFGKCKYEGCSARSKKVSDSYCHNCEEIMKVYEAAASTPKGETEVQSES